MEFMGRLGWQIIIDVDKPWVQLIRSRYRRKFLTLDTSPHGTSWIWKGILASKQLLK